MKNLISNQAHVALVFVIIRLVYIQCQNNETHTINSADAKNVTLTSIIPNLSLILIPDFLLPTTKPDITPEFPMAEVFNLNYLFHTINLYQCTVQHSYGEKKHCRCSKNCMKSRSCCIDVDWNKNSPVSSEIYLQRLMEKAKRYKKLSCRRAIDVNNQESETYYYMVATCLPGSNMTDKQKCNKASDELYDSVPVLGNDEYLYKNTYCARCNFVEKYEHVKITGACIGTPVLPPGRDLTKEDFSRFPQCSFWISSTQNKKLPTCKPQTFCTTENRTLYELCHAYDAPLSIPKYKNYHCFLCDKQSDKSLNLNTLNTGLDYCLQNFCRLPNGQDGTKHTTSFNVFLDSSKHIVISDLKQKFPIRQFLNIPLDYKFSMDTGLEQYLCNSFNNPEKCCRCNPDCMTVRERKCCIDAFWNETNPLPLDLYLQTFTKKYNQIKDYTCEPVYPDAKTLGQETEYRFMIKRCASVEPSEDVTSCIRNSNVTTAGNIKPVFGSDGNLYANAFCARCNMIFDYVYTNVSMECRFEDVEEIKNDNPTKEIRINLPRLRGVDCRFRIIHNDLYKSKECNISEGIPANRECSNSNDVENLDLCNSYYWKFGDYANYHCWKCNNRDVSSTHFIWLIEYCDTPTCSDCVVVQSMPEIQVHHIISDTISFSSDVPSLIDKYTGLDETCNKGETIDFKELKCVKVTCPPNYQLIDFECEQERPFTANAFSIVEDVTHKKCLVARSSTIYVMFSDTCINNSTFLNQFKKAYLVVNVSFHLIYSKENTTIYKASSKVTIKLMQSFELDLVNSLRIWDEKVNIVIATDIDSSVISSTYGLDPSRIYPNNRLCSNNPKRLNVKTIQFANSSCDVTLHDKYYQNNATSFWISFLNGTATENIAVCDQFHLSSSCARKVLAAKTNIDPDNNNLIHMHANGVDIYQPYEYMPVADGYSVCVTLANSINVSSRRSLKFEQLYIIAYYISIVATCISCVCYIWIIGTYLTFSDLRTIPGFNNIFMCLSLFLSDSLYLVSLGANDYTKACTGIAIVRHWSSLCAFMWTVVIASDLVSRFGSFSVASHDCYIQRVVRRCLFAYLIPTIVVAIAVILDNASEVNIGYGSNGICWITNLYARIGFYIVPVACISLFTFLALVYTLSHIYKDKTRVENVLKRDKNSRKSFVKIALKLVIILGLPEFIGFVQIPGSVSEAEEAVNATFRFLYTILKSCRGIMLWFVYILGGHVMNKYKKRFKKYGFQTSDSRNEQPRSKTHTSTTSV